MLRKPLQCPESEAVAPAAGTELVFPTSAEYWMYSMSEKFRRDPGLMQCSVKSRPRISSLRVQRTRRCGMNLHGGRSRSEGLTRLVLTAAR